MATYSNYEITKTPQLENNCDYLIAKELVLRNIGSEVSSEKKRLYEESLKKFSAETNLLIEKLSAKEQEIWNERLRLNSLKTKNNCSDKLGNAKISLCISIDQEIKVTKDRIAEIYKKIDLKPSEKRELDSLKSKLLTLENSFAENECRALFENYNLEQSAMLLTDKSSIQEKNVLKGNYKEQYIYIGIGSVLLLASLYLISKK